MGDVAGYQVRGLIGAVKRLNLDADALLCAANIEPLSLSDPEARFPETQMALFWMALEKAYGEADLGLRLSESMPFGSFELVDHLAASCATIGDGIRSLDNYAKICSSGMTYHLEEVGGDNPGYLVRAEHEHGNEWLPQTLQDYLWGVAIARFRIVWPDYCPTLWLPYPRQVSAERYRQVLGQAPLDGAPTMFVPDAQWNMENPKQDPMLLQLLRAHAADVQARLPAEDPSSIIRHHVAQTLRRGDASIQQVSARLGMSPRTLQRQLAARDERYQDVVDEVRRDQAMRYLASSRLALKEIAALLGYSDPSAFGRAFRRWTGSTPDAFRRRAE